MPANDQASGKMREEALPNWDECYLQSPCSFLCGASLDWCHLMWLCSHSCPSAASPQCMCDRSLPLFIQCLGRFAWLPQAHVFLCGRMPPSFHVPVLQQPHLNDVLHEPSLFIHCLGLCVRLMHARVFLSKSGTVPMIITPPSTAATPPTMWAQSRHSINAPYNSCRKSSSYTSAAGVGGVTQAQAHAKTWVKV